jgi:Bacterial Ig-like domain
MKLRITLFYGIAVVYLWSLTLFTSSCAQIGLPSGGAKDTIAPKLVKATPAYGSRNVKSNKITLEFNEYIDVQELQQNLIVSPLQKKNPTIISNPRSLSIKFKDSLLPNTTYTINFGDAIKDVNEGNVYKNLSYTFSTGNTLDSLSISGKVIIAETGKTDSTLIVMLYRNAVDSTVTKFKPTYIAKIDGEGNFEFNNLPASSFKIYALKDGDGGKTYNAASELFAFSNTDVSTLKKEDITLFAYAEQKETAPNTSTIKTITKTANAKKLKFTTNINNSKQDLLEPIEVRYSSPIKQFDNTKIYITDTLYNKIKNIKISTDSTLQKITLSNKWQADIPLILIIDSLAAIDSFGNKIIKNDTIRFFTKRVEEYGKLVLRFNELDISKNPVLEFLIGDDIKYSFPLLTKEWTNSMFNPGEYGIRILYDTDKNGKWTPGNYTKKLQPEKAVTLPQKLSVRADWENEREINL